MQLPVRQYANKNVRMTTTIFTWFLRALNASKGVQYENMLLVDNCAAHAQDVSFIRNVGVVYYPTNCTSMSQPPDLCHHKMVQVVIGNAQY